MEEARWKSGEQLYKRRQHYKEFYYYYEDIMRVIRGYPEVDFRFLITPTSNLPTKFFPIYATSDEIQGQIDLGYEDAKKVIINSGYTKKSVPNDTTPVKNDTKP